MHSLNSTLKPTIPAAAGGIIASPPVYHQPAAFGNSTFGPVLVEGDACGHAGSEAVCGNGLCCNVKSNTCNSDAISCGPIYCLLDFSTGCRIPGAINEKLQPQTTSPRSRSSSSSSFQKRQSTSAEYADSKSSTSSDLLKRPSLRWLFRLPRPELGSVPYGELITTCYEPGTVALTFDDGPWQYTEDLLDILRDYEAAATFFVCGGNMGGDGQITDHGHPKLLRRMVKEGHQVATHTWGHPDLVTVDRHTIIEQLLRNEQALVQAIGQIPTYFRPPYFSTNDDVLDTVGELGYHIINANVDTNDWKGDYDAARQTFSQAIQQGQGDGSGGKIVLAHDIHDRTVHELAAYMIEEARDAGFRLVTVGECMGDPKQNWYRDPSTGGPYSSASSKPGSRDVISPRDGHSEETVGLLKSYYLQNSTKRLHKVPLEKGPGPLLPLPVPTPTGEYKTLITRAPEPTDSPTDSIDTDVARRELEEHDEPPQPSAISLAFGPGAGRVVNEGGFPSSKATFALVLALVTVFFLLQ